MTVYYFKYRGKPSPSKKVFVYVSSNKAKANKARTNKIKNGFKCSGISTGNTIYGGRVK